MVVKAEKWVAEPILIITESTRKSTKSKNQQKEQGEETKKTEALIVPAGGIIYGGYSNELIIQSHGNGVCEILLLHLCFSYMGWLVATSVAWYSW